MKNWVQILSYMPRIKKKNNANRILHIVMVNSPRNAPKNDKIEVAETVRLSLSAILDTLSIEELSRIAGRITYREFKLRGWKKKRQGKSVSWQLN